MIGLPKTNLACTVRSRGATTATNAGIPDRLFKKHGRWQFQKAKDGQVKHSMKSLLCLSGKLGIWFTRLKYWNYQVFSNQYLLCCDPYLQFSHESTLFAIIISNLPALWQLELVQLIIHSVMPKTLVAFVSLPSFLSPRISFTLF